MRVTLHTNYAMRLLMYCALRKDTVVPTTAVATAFGISEHHLTKIAQCLSRAGIIETVRGRAGGVVLRRPPEEINVGSVVRLTEDNLDLVECFSAETNTCPLAPECRFRNVLAEALEAFLAVLDRFTLADLVRDGDALGRLIGLEPVGAEEPVEV